MQHFHTLYYPFYNRNNHHPPQSPLWYILNSDFFVAHPQNLLNFTVKAIYPHITPDTSFDDHEKSFTIIYVFRNISIDQLISELFDVLQINIYGLK